MANLNPELLLVPQERKDGTWFVKAERPNRATQHIGDFKTEAEAQDWIITQSGAYFGDLGKLL
jgi:hypothetical protein